MCCLLQFIWANYLRGRVPMVLMAVPDVEGYVQHAITHAQHEEACTLPGFVALTKLQPPEQVQEPPEQPQMAGS